MAHGSRAETTPMPQGGPGPGSGLWAALLILVVCAVAVGHGLRTTSGLSWPFDEDLYRDIAQARTMADGAWLADPFYRGESIWYNPLTPALIAVTSKLGGVAANEASLRLGPWLGLVAPLGFTLLVASLIGRWGAVAALVMFVFVTPGGLHPLLCATYSPWPFAAQVAQGPFYLGLAALAAALTRSRLRWFLLVGALLGLTFLAHTASALLLGAVASSLLLLGREAGTRTRRAAWLGAVLALASAVASPFLWSILGRYHLRVVNPEPGAYVWPGTGLDSLGGILRGALDRPALIGLVLAGVIALLVPGGASARSPAARRVIGAWAFWGVILLSYVFAQPALRSLGLPAPPLVPAFHFWALLGGLVSLVAGLGALWLGTGLASLLTPRPERRSALVALVTVFLALGLAVASYPSWRTRDDFVATRRVAEFHSRMDRIRAHEWIRRHTSVDDVFLAEHDAGLRVVATAGRRLVALDAGFSSPFVPWPPRAAAAARMLASLRPGGHEAFHPLAVEYHVSYVVLQRPSAEEPFPEAPFVGRVFQRGNVAVYRTGCWPENDAPDGR
jgi:hypothetical protein